MCENLPFKNCNDDELKTILSAKNKIIKTNQATMTTRKRLALNLPFYNCSDYAMLTACLSDKDKLLEFFENINFTSECQSY